MRRVFIFIAVIVLSVGAIWAAGKPEAHELLVTTEWLAENSSSAVLIEVGRKTEDFSSGHIPGAQYFDRSSIYGEVDGVPGMFRGVEAAVAGIEAAGISNDDEVVIYDNARSLWATRLFWTLEYLGHKKVSVLDGGLAKWTAEGRTVETGTSSATAGSFAPKVNDGLLISAQEINAGLDELDIIDTRSAKEYAGEDVRAERGGHIPGSVHIEWVMNITGDEVPTFLSVTELGEFYESYDVDKSDRVVTLCQTGVRGAHTYFALRLAGYEDVSLYDGSWVEWGNSDYEIDVPSES